jgi:hypothetical protein
MWVLGKQHPPTATCHFNAAPAFVEQSIQTLLGTYFHPLCAGKSILMCTAVILAYGPCCSLDPVADTCIHPLLQDDPNATPIYEVEDISKLVVDTSTSGTQWGTGGMSTKLTAGRIATAAGCTMVGGGAARQVDNMSKLVVDASTSGTCSWGYHSEWTDKHTEHGVEWVAGAGCGPLPFRVVAQDLAAS